MSLCNKSYPHVVLHTWQLHEYAYSTYGVMTHARIIVLHDTVISWAIFSCRATHATAMGWLRFVGSLELQVSFAEYSLFCRALSQKRPTFLRSLLIVATPYTNARNTCGVMPHGRVTVLHDTGMSWGTSSCRATRMTGWYCGSYLSYSTGQGDKASNNYDHRNVLVPTLNHCVVQRDSITALFKGT